MYCYASRKEQILAERDWEWKKLDKLFSTIVNNAATAFEHGVFDLNSLKKLYRQSRLDIKVDKDSIFNASRANGSVEESTEGGLGELWPLGTGISPTPGMYQLQNQYSMSI